VVIEDTAEIQCAAEDSLLLYTTPYEGKWRSSIERLFQRPAIVPPPRNALFPTAIIVPSSRLAVSVPFSSVLEFMNFGFRILPPDERLTVFSILGVL